MKNFTRKFIGLLTIMFTLGISQTFAQTTLDFNYTGASQEWIVPCGVTEIQVDAYGASGTTSILGYGENIDLGKGGRVEGTIAVTPGQILKIYVGGSSHYTGYSSQVIAGWNGGGGSYDGFAGGGATDIRIGGDELTDRILVAGGAGGRSGYGCGAHGGGLTADNGCEGYYDGNAGAGKGGSQSSGGAGAIFWGSSSYQYTSAGGFGYGSSGSSQTSQYGGGGGGGGGWYGGSGGGNGGGGGGSSYTHPDLVSNVIHTKGVKTGAGKIFISYNVGDVGSCYVDECGVINGDNSSCSDECGVPNGDNTTCMDECGVINGPGYYYAYIDTDGDGIGEGEIIESCSNLVLENNYASTGGDIEITGCTNSEADNYLSSANTDDGTCIITGCMDLNDAEYNENANTDGSCFCSEAWEDWNEYQVYEMYYYNFTEFAQDYYNSYCVEPEILGCTDGMADNFDYEANTDDGSCYKYGCMEEYANNYDQYATLEDDCVFYGCTDLSAINYNPLATADDGSCTDACNLPISLLSQGGNEGGSYGNWAWFAGNLTNVITAGDIVYGSNGTAYTIAGEMSGHHYTNGISQVLFTSSVYGVFTNGNSYESNISYCSYGCTNPEAENFNPLFNVDDGSCVGAAYGCTNSTAVNYNEEANSDDGSCIIEGCTDGEAFNYNEEATEDNGSCVAVVNGCMDEFACNYNSDANTDDSSCDDPEENYDCHSNCINDTDEDGVCDELEIGGCTDQLALNYSEYATEDDGSCIDVVSGCMDSSMSNYNSEANTEDGSCISWEELANSLQSELNNVVPEDGITQADVDDAAEQAFANGVASVEVPECEEVATQNIPLDLPQGWSMFGYTCLESLDVVDAFSDISDNIEIVKDEWGLAYLPAWGFSAFDNLEFGEGYQIKMIEEVTDFQFCEAIAPEDGVSQADVDAAVAAVVASYAGWCASDIDNDGICDADEVSGCMDASSCNYVAVAEFDDSSCEYTSCLDECGVINGDNSTCLDCAGVVNGTSEDLGCGCGNPQAQAGYDCDGNEIVVLQIGDQHAGGIVFYIDETGQHGLVAAMEDVPGEYIWGCIGTMISGADGQAIGTGYQNTLDIVEGCSETNTAAFNALNSTAEGYTDWFLPSRDELVEMYNTIGKGGPEGNIGGFSSNWYWSSSEANNGGAWVVHFASGPAGNANKDLAYRVRVIRAF